MRPKLKINNLTNLQDARYSAAVGFDYVSFSLERGSVKKLAPNLIWNIVNWLEGPEVILELNTYSLEELDDVDKVFSYRFISLPFEEWSDLVFQKTQSIILRGNESINEETILKLCEDAQKRDFQIKFEIVFSDLTSLKSYRKVLPYLFVRFSDFSLTRQLVEKQEIFPYGISIGEEVDDDGLMDYDRVDSFIELFNDKLKP